ncbi:hypothetical protein SORBI_3001G343766 [Sorghum bicolor]|uniref:Ubiquitin-like protease family profile domain-containing protein n=1 Tax=Sorghum bicolor TaxID=4558 RepID=A0A1Z5S9D5_SORBI|nr:hypothetical protein SORBI_3001G343766 [Sorghum bicolor]
METRGRKKRRVEDVCSQDEFVDLEGSQSDDVVCSQYANDDSFLNKSSSDVELFSVDSSSDDSGPQRFNKTLYKECLKDFNRIRALKRKMYLALVSQSKKKKSSSHSSGGFTRQSLSEFSSVITSMSEAKKDVIRRYGFGSLLLFDKCFVPKKFTKWLASLIESKSGDLIVNGKVISLTAKSMNLVLGIPVSGTPFPSNYSAGRAIVLSKIDKTSLPQVSFFADKLTADDLTDDLVLICFLVVALHCFLCPNSNLVPSPRYLGIFEDLEHMSSFDWSGFVLRWLLDGVKSFNKVKKVGQKSSGTLGGCMFYLAVIYLDHVDFSHRHVSESFPRIAVWKQNMIKDFSDLDVKTPSGYGMRPLLDFEKTCYHKALHSHQESGAEFSDGAEFLTKLEEACGCHVPDSLKASLLEVIEDHCNSCLPSIPIDLVSLGALPVELKTMFSKLMNHVYSFKQNSEELVIKVLKEFADYESSSDPPTVSPVMASASKNVNAIHEPHDSQVNVEKDKRASLAKDTVVSPVSSPLGCQGVVGVAPSSSSKCVPSCLKKQIKFGSDVAPTQPYDPLPKSVQPCHLVGKSSSNSLPSHVVEDVIHVAIDHDSDVLAGAINSQDHLIPGQIVMQTLPFSDDESPHITPELSKKLPPISQLKSSSKAGSSVGLPINVSSPEVTIVGSRSLSQKLMSMGKKSEALYDSKLQSSRSGLVTPRPSVSKVHGYPSVIGNQFSRSSSKSDFKISESSTGGKVPLHGPRRVVKPSHYVSDEFEIQRVKFKVSKSQIMKYKAICNLAMSRNSGDDAILFGGVRCTFWALGESLKPGGFVINFVMAAFCYHLYSQPSGHLDVSKCHYFFSSISDQLLKDSDVANEDILNKAFTRTSKSRPLYCSNLLFFPCLYDEHWFVFVVDIKDRSFVFLDSYYGLQDEYQVEMRDKLISNFKFWWKKFGLIDMGFHGYTVSYHFVPKQAANNLSDSGIFAMMFLEHWKSPRSSIFTLFKESDIPNLRIKFANDLVFSAKNTGRKDLVTSYQFEIMDYIKH